jgi:hypothetical protein
MLRVMLMEQQVIIPPKQINQQTLNLAQRTLLFVQHPLDIRRMLPSPLLLDMPWGMQLLNQLTGSTTRSRAV